MKHSLTDMKSWFENLEERLGDIKVSLRKFLFHLSDNVQNKRYHKSEDYKVKLPDASLSKFYSNIEHSNNFQFDSLILNNLALSDTQKAFLFAFCTKWECSIYGNI